LAPHGPQLAETHLAKFLVCLTDRFHYYRRPQSSLLCRFEVHETVVRLADCDPLDASQRWNKYWNEHVINRKHVMCLSMNTTGTGRKRKVLNDATVLLAPCDSLDKSQLWEFDKNQEGETTVLSYDMFFDDSPCVRALSYYFSWSKEFCFSLFAHFAIL